MPFARSAAQIPWAHAVAVDAVNDNLTPGADIFLPASNLIGIAPDGTGDRVVDGRSIFHETNVEHRDGSAGVQQMLQLCRRDRGFHAFVPRREGP